LATVVAWMLLAVLAVATAYGGWRLGGFIYRMPMIQGVDGLLGVFVQGFLAVSIICSFLTGMIGLGRALAPGDTPTPLTSAQMAEMRRQLAPYPFVAGWVEADLRASAASANAEASPIKGIKPPSLAQIEGFYSGVVTPQLHSSRLAPVMLALGKHLPGSGRAAPGDLPRK
jgi:hypothetical protein